MPIVEAAVILERSGEPMSEEDFLEIAPEQYLQICQAQVTVEGVMRIYRLLGAEHIWKDSHLRSLALDLIDEHSDAESALIVESQQGNAVVYINKRLEPKIVEIAAAVAVMKASWGWDESPFFVVEINNYRCLVWTRFNGDHRIAEVINWKTVH